MQFTPFGRILRAGSRDPEMVGLLGIRLPRVLTAVFGLGCAIAGIAGVLAAPLWTVIPSMSENAIMPAFVVVAIGGLGSFAGAVIAGLMVGVVTALTIQFQPDAAERDDVRVHGGGAAAAPARPAGRAVGAVRVSAQHSPPPLAGGGRGRGGLRLDPPAPSRSCWVLVCVLVALTMLGRRSARRSA